MADFLEGGVTAIRIVIPVRGKFEDHGDGA